jgi:hypothetical protein
MPGKLMPAIPSMGPPGPKFAVVGACLTQGWAAIASTTS